MTIKELIKCFKGKTKKEIIRLVVEERKNIDNTSTNGQN